MPRKTKLEMKIRWYYNHCSSQIDIIEFETILLSDFDEFGELIITYPDELKARYIRYWKKLNLKITGQENSSGNQGEPAKK